MFLYKSISNKSRKHTKTTHAPQIGKPKKGPLKELLQKYSSISHVFKICLKRERILQRISVDKVARTEYQRQHENPAGTTKNEMKIRLFSLSEIIQIWNSFIFELKIQNFRVILFIRSEGW